MIDHITALREINAITEGTEPLDIARIQKIAREAIAAEIKPVGWETEQEWQLELRAFHWGPETPPEETRKLINDLWAQYCYHADPSIHPVTVPKLTQEMIEAACIAHYGKKRVAMVGGSHGVAMTVDDIDYNFTQAFRRMWKGVRSAIRREKK